MRGHIFRGIQETGDQTRVPNDITEDSKGNIYINEFGNSAVRKINTTGTISTVAGDGIAGFSGDGGAATSARSNTPYAICLDAANNLYITDNANERIRKVDTLGNISTIVGTGASGHSGDGGPATAATIYNTGGITFDAAGNMLIADFGNNAIRKVAFGIISTGIPEMTKQVSDYTIFPNPTTNSITIISSEIITAVKSLTYLAK